MAMTDERHEQEPALDGDTEFTRRMWHAYLTGEGSPFEGFQAFMQSTFSRLPSDPRCKICQAPFRGIGSLVLRSFGFSASAWQMNPNLCNRCEVKVRQDEVGVEVDVTMMFADVRGSTSLAERLGPAEFHHLIDRFYRAATAVLIESDALIEKLIGDEVAGIYVPGIAGPAYSRRAVMAAQALLAETGTGSADDESWIEIGAGVHSGHAYVGAVGSETSMSVITVLGEAANTAARLASAASAGEILVSESTCLQAGLDLADCDSRTLELKGVREPLGVRVLQADSARVAV